MVWRRDSVTQQINLYDPRLRPRRELATARNLGLGAAALLVLTTALALYLSSEAARTTAAHRALQSEVQAEQERVQMLTKANAERRVSPDLAAEMANTKALLATREEVMEVLDSGRLGNTSGFSETMYGFARLATSDVWLTGFSVSAGGENIEIRGRMLDPAKLPAYVQRLSKEPVFHGRRFAALDMRSVEPELSAPESAAAGAVVPVASAQPAALQRFVEFVLRSANMLPSTVGAKQ